jgi:carbamoyl-phosphate synthase small subunit
LGRAQTTAKLVLEDGTSFSGKSFGARGEKVGEVVFNTSMTGYQEILSDPSYKGQIVTMTYPLIGNYGVNEEDFESHGPQVEGFAVKEASRIVSNFRAKRSVQELLEKHAILGIEDIDTRMLTKHIRSAGAMMGVISTEDLDERSLQEKAASAPKMEGSDFVKDVTIKGFKEWREGANSPFYHCAYPDSQATYSVVAIDYGIKYNILRLLVCTGCDVTLAGAFVPADEILGRKPDGIFLSNGPGDPAVVRYAIKTVGELIGKRPIFGICLGHQLLAHAFGGKTYKMKFGHHGANQPVMDLATRKVEITCQNHGFAVDPESLDKNELAPSHVNLNDRSNEGLVHKELPVFSVQYHPEASPGPHDAGYLFKRFTDMIETGRPPEGYF